MQQGQHQSIRLFKNDFLEKLTKVHPITPLLIFLPVLGYLSYRSFFEIRLNGLYFITLAVLGVLSFSLFEYCMHRFLFHFKPIGPISKRILYLFHGIHHDDPHDPMRLVMPPSVGIPLAWLVSCALDATFPMRLKPSFFFGFLVGYLFYDMGHYAIHHLNIRSEWFKKIKKHHYLHHFDDSENGFGVSSPLWDVVLGTTFKSEDSEVASQNR